MNTQWLGERFLHGLIYVSISLAACFLLYKVFLQPTSTQKQVYQAPSTHKLENATIKIEPCGRFFDYDMGDKK